MAMMVAFGGPPAAFAGFTDAVKAKTLSNGLTVLVLEDHRAPIATLSVFYRVGSRNEQFGKTGLSHLIEHLMFRASKKLKPDEFFTVLQSNGGIGNATTGPDFTNYWELINKDHFEVPISLEADQASGFEPKGFDAEKQVVMEERRMRIDDAPRAALWEATQAAAFVEHPYHWTVVGWMHDLQELTLEDALAYHARYYSPRNAIIVAVGDFDAQQVLKQITEAFGDIKNGPPPPPMTSVEPPQQGERRVELRHAADLPAFLELYHAPNYRETSDAFALELMSIILSDGDSSRLWKDLVIDKRMVVNVDSGYLITSFDPSLFSIEAQMRPGVKPEDALSEIDRKLEELRDHPVAADELQKAKNRARSDFIFAMDSIRDRAFYLGLDEMIGSYKWLDLYVPNSEKVTAGDIQRVARNYLTKTNLTVGVLVPTGLLPHSASSAMQPLSEIR